MLEVKALKLEVVTKLLVSIFGMFSTYDAVRAYDALKTKFVLVKTEPVIYDAVAACEALYAHDAVPCKLPVNEVAIKLPVKLTVLLILSKIKLPLPI